MFETLLNFLGLSYAFLSHVSVYVRLKPGNETILYIQGNVKKRLMKSQASIKSHPIHPILVAFPIAFFTATLLLDISIMITDSSNIIDTAARYLNLAGIIAAVLAAIPGIIDYEGTVPPNSSAKKRATSHALLNTAMLALFTLAYFLRENATPYLIIALEIPAFVLMSIAGWKGGTLVYRNLIGVDMRYANAGKWKEASIRQTAGLIEVAKTDELNVNQMKLLHVGDKRIALARTEILHVAFDDRCTHRGGSLAGGTMICSTVQCPWHGSQFDVEDGEVKAGPAKQGIKTYKVIEKDGKVFIELP